MKGKRLKVKGVVLTVVFYLLPTGYWLLATSHAFQGPPGCGQECSSCHTLTKDEAATILKAEVKDVRSGPVKGLWEVEGIQNGNRFIVYLDFAKKHLILVNRFIAVEAISAPPQFRKLDLSKIPLNDALIMGNPKAKAKIIIFDDPDCPYCKKLHEEVKRILEKRDDIAFYIKLYPLDIHPKAYDKSKTIQCKKSIKLLEEAFEGKEFPRPDCPAKEIDENIKLAKELGIAGTPAIILPDGRLIPGYVDAPTLLNLLGIQ
ncbi:MAG: DsbC family protein [Deltaproteobacteria bacterium]|nr:DsbC family protein [Deltaproteobacteria bacterium]